MSLIAATHLVCRAGISLVGAKKDFFYADLPQSHGTVSSTKVNRNDPSLQLDYRKASDHVAGFPAVFAGKRNCGSDQSVVVPFFSSHGIPETIA